MKVKSDKIYSYIHSFRVLTCSIMAMSEMADRAVFESTWRRICPDELCEMNDWLSSV